MIFSDIEWGGWASTGFTHTSGWTWPNLMNDATSHFAWGVLQKTVFLVLNYSKDPLKLTAFVQGYEHGVWTNHDNSINWFQRLFFFGVRFRMLECMQQSVRMLSFTGRNWGIRKNSWFCRPTRPSSWWYRINMHHFGTQPSQSSVENTAG